MYTITRSVRIVSMLMLCLSSVSVANEIHSPNTADIAPLPVMADHEYQPPRWLNDCAVVVAGSEVKTTTSCLPTLTTSNKGSGFDFNRVRQVELDTLNREINSVLPEETITLEQAIEVTVAKKGRLLELGWPSIILSYAVVEAPLAHEEETVIFVDHFVLLIVFNTRALVLDSMVDEIVPWQYSAHRIYGAEISGTWHPVEDDRHDPLDLAIEWYEAVYQAANE